MKRKEKQQNQEKFVQTNFETRENLFYRAGFFNLVVHCLKEILIKIKLKTKANEKHLYLIQIASV